MKTIIVCGMLGSGKTTYIRNAALRSDERAVVLVNDFGSVGIDGDLLEAGGLHAIELPSGCVCCTLRVDLIETIKKVKDELDPEVLYIEPSGVASPSAVLGALKDAGVRDGATVICIVDATEFPELYESGMYGSFMEDQLRSADVILINKADIAGPGLVRKSSEIAASVNPAAIVWRSVNARITDRLSPDAGEGAHEARPADEERDLHCETVSIRTARKIPYILVKKFFDDINEGLYGEVVRAKGIVRTDRGSMRFDLAYGNYSEEKFEGEITESRIVLIGDRIEKEKAEGFI